MNEKCYEVDAEPLFTPKDTDRLVTEGYSVNLQKYFREGWAIFKANAINLSIYSTLVLAVLFFFMAFFQIVVPFLIWPLSMGFFVFSAKKIKDQPARFGNFFDYFEYIVPLMLVSIVSEILVAIGFLLLVLPGIYLTVAYMFPFMLVIDRKLSFWDAMEVSRKIVTKNWFMLFLLYIILLAINIVGAFLLIFGLIPALALTFCILTAAYEDIIGLQSTDF